MMLIGYARENAEEQTLLHQVEALRKAGCKKIYEEKVPTMSRDWPVLGRILTELSSDDTLIVYSLDRLAWSTPHLLEVADRLREKEAGLRSLCEPWADTTVPYGQMILGVFAGIAEFERALSRNLTETGRKRAKERGVHLGRPAKLSAEQIATIQKLVRDENISISEVAARFGVHKATIYRAVTNNK
ncbi:DNA resolvase [Komagataeibacter diospyri]|uniref:recombinase family protein n=1 Tax=Komagataeibacter diospyri TaxID=1932662 RepID=UPI00113B0C16|nr:recombinase family protein [Komagataeibacter diospyri]GCE88859.1 DNA resolvase [Komagataeibacter diospyri]